MKLHEDKEQLADAIRITAAELGIPHKFVEKDYWICQILQRLSRMPQAERTVWKGGTSLTKGYGIIQRFSSDVDLAIIGEGLSNNQQKKPTFVAMAREPSGKKEKIINTSVILHIGEVFCKQMQSVILATAVKLWRNPKMFLHAK